MGRHARVAAGEPAGGADPVSRTVRGRGRSVRQRFGRAASGGAEPGLAGSGHGASASMRLTAMRGDLAARGAAGVPVRGAAGGATGGATGGAAGVPVGAFGDLPTERAGSRASTSRFESAPHRRVRALAESGSVPRERPSAAPTNPATRQPGGRADLGTGGAVRAVAAAVLLAGAVVLWWAQASAGSDVSPSPLVLPVPTTASADAGRVSAMSTPVQPSYPARAGPGPTTQRLTAVPSIAVPSSAVPGSAGVAPTQQAVPPDTSWLHVLADLESSRSEAFRTGNGSLLDQVYAAGSAPLARDLLVLEELDREGLHAEGLRLVVDGVEVVLVEPARATLRVNDRLPAYTVVDAAGAVVEQVPARGPVTWVLTMAPSAAGWRIAEVVRA